MQKSKPVAYVTYKIRTTDRIELLEQLKHVPLTNTNYNFVLDIISGMSYKELAEKYHKSESRIYKWKRQIYEDLHNYDMRQLRGDFLSK